MELKSRHIVIKFILDEGTFENTNRQGEKLNTKIIKADSSGHTLSVKAQISKVAGFMQSSAEVTIYGMNENDINTLSLMQFMSGQFLSKNVIEIYAGYELNVDGIPPLAYRGQIYYAMPDYNDPSRSRPFKIISMYGIEEQNGTTNGAVSLKGEITLENLFNQIASQFKGLNFVSNNLFGYTTTNPRYEGSPIQQMNQCCADFGYHWKIDNNNLLVSPLGKPFYPDDPITISSENGELGYPSGVPLGLMAKIRFSPLIKYGQSVVLKSQMPFTNKFKWYINGITHYLTNHEKDFYSILQLNAYQFGGDTQ